MRVSFTGLRKEILGCIEGSEQPLMAKDIFDRLESKPNLSTVYRALDFLCKRGLIKSVFFNSEASYFFSSKKAHAHFLYCNECSDIQVFDKCFAERIQDDIEHEFDYKITDHFFYFSGLCDSCQQHKKDSITA